MSIAQQRFNHTTSLFQARENACYTYPMQLKSERSCFKLEIHYGTTIYYSQLFYFFREQPHVNIPNICTHDRFHGRNRARALEFTLSARHVVIPAYSSRLSSFPALDNPTGRQREA